MVVSTGLLAVPATAGAEPWTFIGPRYQAMGGAGVATVNDATASYWNPGALAFLPAESHESGFPLSFSTTLEGEALRDLDDIHDFVEDTSFASILDDMANGAALTPQELQDALELVAGKGPNLSTDGEGFLGLPEADLTFRRGRLTVMFRGSGSLGLGPVLDTTGLSFSTDTTALAQVANVVGAGNDRSPQFTNPGSQGLADSIAGLANWTQDQAEELVYQGEQAGLDTGRGSVQQILTRVAEDTGTLGVPDLSSNDSGAEIRGLLTQEVGVGYAHPLFEGRLGLGGNVRYVRGVTTSRLFRFEDLDNGKDLIRELADFDNETTSHRVGLDAGLLLRPNPRLRRLRFGLVARNLNSPDFAVDGADDIELQPQVRAGIAFDLLPRWTIASDVDVIENESDAVDGFASRLLSVGSEYRIPLNEFSLALRAGAYTNLASGADRALTVTAGVGLRFGSLAFDLAVGASPELEEIEDGGTRIPKSINVSAALHWIMEP